MSEKWESADMDLLMDLFLRGGEMAAIAETLGRTKDATRGQLWKMCVRYDRESVRNYCPNRLLRHGEYSNREHLVLALACSHTGIVNGAHDPGYISKLLARAIWDVNKYMDDIMNQSRRLGMVKYERARLVHLELSDVYHELKGLLE